MRELTAGGLARRRIASRPRPLTQRDTHASSVLISGRPGLPATGLVRCWPVVAAMFLIGASQLTGVPWPAATFSPRTAFSWTGTGRRGSYRIAGTLSSPGLPVAPPVNGSPALTAARR